MSKGLPGQAPMPWAFQPARALLILLVATGWLFMTIQSLELSMRGTVADAGPGMALFTFLTPYFSGLQVLYSICVTRSVDWGVVDFAKALAMWQAMVLAMMVPTLLPGFQRQQRPFGPALRFVTFYLLAWLGFCLVAVGLQWLLRSAQILDAHMVSTELVLNAAVLIFAGVFQLTCTKRRHLKACQRSLHGAPGDRSAVRSGWIHGVQCVKCCWPLMLTMFVFGLMNLLAMAALTGLIVIEKTLTDAGWVGKSSGIAFILAGVVVALV